jgi:hypothetical protein
MVSSFEKEIADKTAFKSNGFVRNARTPKRDHLPQLQHYDYVPKENPLLVNVIPQNHLQ